MSERERRVPRSAAPEPGSVRMVEVDGRRIGLFNVAGRFYALADRCPHRGGPLCSAGEIVGQVMRENGEVRLVGEGEFVRCPWHKWDFEIATGRAPADGRMRVRRYAVRVDGDEVVVSLGLPLD